MFAMKLAADFVASVWFEKIFASPDRVYSSAAAREFGRTDTVAHSAHWQAAVLAADQWALRHL